MKTETLSKLILIIALGFSFGCRHSLAKTVLQLRSAESPRPVSSKPEQPVRQILDVEYEAYRLDAYNHLSDDDFAWLDREAVKVRSGKERLPGGYWKIRTLYSAMETPLKGQQASDEDWSILIDKLSRWSKRQPKSVTALVALAQAWQKYAWKARGGGYADTVSEKGAELFRKRLEISNQILSRGASLKDRCPHWYVIALWTAIGRGADRDTLEELFDAGVKLEPTYYYLYQVKASYLLPRWLGEDGEWERFAEAKAKTLGGEEGDMIFFAIYSQMRTMHDMTFMNTHQADVPRIIAGYYAMEKSYGFAPHRLNEACFFAAFGPDRTAARKLFERVGDNYDLSVWRSKQTFEIFRQGVRKT